MSGGEVVDAIAPPRGDVASGQRRLRGLRRRAALGSGRPLPPLGEGPVSWKKRLTNVIAFIIESTGPTP
jgi:hypothetical protein